MVNYKYLTRGIFICQILFLKTLRNFHINREICLNFQKNVLFFKKSAIFSSSFLRLLHFSSEFDIEKTRIYNIFSFLQLFFFISFN